MTSRKWTGRKTKWRSQNGEERIGSWGLGEGGRAKQAVLSKHKLYLKRCHERRKKKERKLGDLVGRGLGRERKFKGRTSDYSFSGLGGGVGRGIESKVKILRKEKIWNSLSAWACD